MSLFYLYQFKFAVKLQIILFENAIIGHFATRAVSGQFWPGNCNIFNAKLCTYCVYKFNENGPFSGRGAKINFVE